MASSAAATGSLACDICGNSKETFKTKHCKLEVKLENPRIFLPGCDGCLIFNDHLKAYFIVTRLFKSDSSKFIKLLVSSSGSASQYSHENGGERVLYSSMCVKCEGIVDRALDLHGKMLNLQKEIDQLGKTLSEFKANGRRARAKEVDLKGDNSQDLSEDNHGHGEEMEDEMELGYENSSDDVPADVEKSVYTGGSKKKKSLKFPDEDESPVTKEHLNSIPDTSVTTFEYQCPECSRIFSKRQNLHKHTKVMHGLNMHYSCPRCPDLKFIKKKLLTEHTIKVHNANGTECDLCGKKLKGDTRENLFQHYQHFHKIKYPCPFCKMTFTTRLSLRNHKKEVHTLTQEEILKLPINRAPKTEEEKEWANHPCLECGKVYVSGYKLDRHLMMKHEHKLNQEERSKLRRKCCFCWKTLYLEQRHWVHCKLDHPEIKVEFPCDQCIPEIEDTRPIYKTTAELLKHFEQKHTGSAIHSCSQCKQPFLNQTLLKAHVKIHINKKAVIPDAEKLVKCPFKCWFCWELFSTEEALQRHLKGNKRHWKLRVEFPCDDLECEYNQKPFLTLDQLKAHLIDHRSHNNQKLFTCERCSWSFLSKEMLALHQVNHVPKLNDQFSCPHPSCDHKVNFWRQLKDHYNVEHGLNLKLYKCSYCDTRFTMKRSLSSHIGNMHRTAADPDPTSSSGFPCEKCGKLCPTEKYLYHHLYRNHKELKCQDCDKNFETLGKYLYHRKVNHGIGNPHMCAICGKVFAQKNALTRHMGVHNDKRFECHLCGKKMYALGTLQTHIKKFHGENEKKKKEQGPSPFRCGECGMGYSRKDSLEDHVRVKHTTGNCRVWSCDKCGKRFKRKGHLDEHTKSKKACFESVTLMQVEMIKGEETGSDKV